MGAKNCGIGDGCIYVMDCICELYDRDGEIV